MDFCPFCDGKVILRCRCLRGDSRCDQGHEWHRCEVHPDRIIGAYSDHGKGGCSCVEGNTYELAHKVSPVLVTVTS